MCSMFTPRLVTVLTTLCAVGCGSAVQTSTDTDGGSTSTGSGSTTLGTATVPGSSTSASTTVSAESSGTDQGSSSGSGDTTTTTTEASSSGEDSCRPIDLLVVVDNSGSMAEEQARLTDSFSSMLGLVPALDAHVMVVDVDSWGFEPCATACEGDCYEPDGTCINNGDPNCLVACSLCAEFTCGTEPGRCDVLGAGVTFPQGQDASNEDCNFSSGARYIDASEPDLEAAFQCAATVGTGSFASNELVMASMVAAVSGADPAASCNTGFLRDEAMLAVLFVTDEAEDKGEDSPGGPEGWRQSLIAAKGGRVEDLLVFGLMGGNLIGENDCNIGDPPEAELAPRLHEFVDSFEDQGLSGSICAPSYEPFLDEAAALVRARACER